MKANVSRLLHVFLRLAVSSAAIAGGSMSFAEVEGLDKTTRVTLSLENAAFSEVLMAFERDTGVAIEVSATYSEAVLSKEVTIQLDKRPFWEAVLEMAGAAELEIDRVDRKRIILGRPLGERAVLAGEPRTVGAFCVIPRYHGMFGDLELVVRPEPRLPLPRVLDFHADLVFENGEQIAFRPRPVSVSYSLAPSNTVQLDIEQRASFEEPLIRDHTLAKQIDLEAELAFPVQWKRVTLPPLSELTPKTVKLGNGTLRIEQAALRDPLYEGKNNLRFFIRTEGVTQNREQELDFALVDESGTRVDSAIQGFGKGEDDGVQWRGGEIGFDPHEVPGDFRSWRLAVSLPGGGEAIVGPVKKIRPSPIEAGINVINIDHAEVKAAQQGRLPPGRHLSVQISASPYRLLPDRMFLETGAETLVEPSGHGYSAVYPFPLNLTFPLENAEAGLDSFRLVMEVPTDAVPHRLNVTLQGVRLTEKSDKP